MSCESDPTKLTVTKGATGKFRFSILNPEGDALDLTDYDPVEFVLKRSHQDADSAAEFLGSLSDGIVLAYGMQDGVIDVSVPATLDLQYGRIYYWWVRLTHSSGDIYIPEKGTLIVLLEAPPNE